MPCSLREHGIEWNHSKEHSEKHAMNTPHESVKATAENKNNSTQHGQTKRQTDNDQRDTVAEEQQATNNKRSKCQENRIESSNRIESKTTNNNTTKRNFSAPSHSE